jgi:chorismate mutase/prephenate dehydratase
VLQDELTQLRQEIDATDREIVELLDKRAAIANRVGAAKKGGVIYKPAREAEVLAHVVKRSDGTMPAESMRTVYREIIAACRNLQQPLRVAYLGPEGTYSEEAARQHCGDTSEYIPVASIDEVVQAIEKGEATVGVVPVENSTEGTVNRTLDLLMQTSLTVNGEIVLPIHHQLLSKAGRLADTSEVIAHPQALAQCRAWLDKHLPHAKRTAASSNAEAVRLAAVDRQAAAIASERASGIYGVPVLARNIEDAANNTTRFLVLGSSEAGVTGSDKTSLICATPNTPGALHKVLAVLASQGINIVKLESRPSPDKLWDYIFYIDIDGHKDDEAVSDMLHLLQDQTIYVKVMGSYPKGVN